MTSVKAPLPEQSVHGASVLGSSATAGSGYFSEQYLQPQPAHGPHHHTPAPAAHSSSSPHAVAASAHPPQPARSPYTESQNFMPTRQPTLVDNTTRGGAGDDDIETIYNTRANAHPATAATTTHHTGDMPVSNGTMTTTTTTTNAAGAAGGPTSTGRFAESWDASQRGSSIMDTDGASIVLPGRSNTLRKKASVRRSGSLHRSSSRRSMRAGSMPSLALQRRGDGAEDETRSAFYCPVPTKGSPTDVLANRFQAWRKILKDLIAYHREIQTHYEHRAKSVQRLSTSLNALTLPPGFMTSGGLDDAAQVLRGYHKQSVSEAAKARDIEEDVILALTGLRSDLSQKIKEIKSISGDFRNNVDKEMEATRRAVKSLQEALGQAELDPSLTTGRQDPYLLRLAADRQLDRQLQEENYLHQAFLNLEKSGRELESIVVGEIQKSYNAYASILKREAAAAWAAIEELRAGPIAMPKDQEWATFLQASDQLVAPDVPLRQVEFVHYPGQDHYACQEIRAGLLERKSKYLKSYTAGWYVLSPTHLHEFKSADKMQAPVMSLYLPEQKLGSHSTESASSSKFVLKGRQSGGLHRGHTWVFRAESYDTMMEWYNAIHALTETTPQEREDYARGHQQHQNHLHARSLSRASQRTYSSDGVNEDDDEPFAVPPAAAAAAVTAPRQGATSSVDGAASQPGSIMAGAAGSSRGVSPSGANALGLRADGQPAYQPYQPTNEAAYQAYPQEQQQQQQQQQSQTYQPYQAEQQYQAYPNSQQFQGDLAQQQQQPIATTVPGAEHAGAVPLAAAGAAAAPVLAPLATAAPATTATPTGEAGTAPVRRPTQGGRFASDLQVNAQRGLEVQAAGIPLSPTSVDESSGSGRSSDYGVIAAAGSLPGTDPAAVAAEGQQAGYSEYAPRAQAPAAASGAVVQQDGAATGGVPPLTNGHTAPVAVATAPVVEKTSRVLGVGKDGAATTTEPTTATRPDTLSRQVSDGTTLANLHIPGQYPGPLETTR